MPTINYAGNTYSGEVLEDLLVYTAQGNDTFKEGLIHIKPGVQKRYVLPGMKLGNIIQDNVPTPNRRTAQQMKKPVSISTQSTSVISTHKT